MFLATLLPNKKGVSQIEIIADNISETRQSISISYNEKIDLSRIADAKKYPDASGIFQTSKQYSFTEAEFLEWYTTEKLVMEILLTALGLQYEKIEKYQNAELVNIKTKTTE